MNPQQIHALVLRETDIDGALKRFGSDEALYTNCLKAFLSDKTISDLNSAITKQYWDEAFTAAHAIKGLAGNMGFVPLMHATGQLVVSIRGGRTQEIPYTLETVNSCYRDITDAIHQFLAYESN